MRARTPTVLQMEAVVVAAPRHSASSRFITACFVPLEEMRAGPRVSSRRQQSQQHREGRPRRYGLNGKGSPRRELDALRAHEAAVHRLLELQSLSGGGGGWAGSGYISTTSASGPRKISHDEFDQSFTGVVLTFDKRPRVRDAAGKRRAPWDWLAHRLRGNSVGLIYVVLSPRSRWSPPISRFRVFARVFVDRILVDGIEAWLHPLLIAMSLAAVVAAVVTWLQQSALARTWR